MARETTGTIKGTASLAPGTASLAPVMATTVSLSLAPVIRVAWHPARMAGPARNGTPSAGNDMDREPGTGDGKPAWHP